MIANFSVRRLIFNLCCYVLLFFVLFGIGAAFYHAVTFKETQLNIANNGLLSREITEREITVSNRDFSVRYEYSTNVVPYSGTNAIVIKIRMANVDVFEIVGTNRNKIDGTMRGIIVKTGNFDRETDRFYVLKALASTNLP